VSDRAAATVESTLHVDRDLRVFDGHFPGSPVLPGAFLLAIVLREVEQRPALRARLPPAVQVRQVKFLAPVGPGQTLRIRLEAQGPDIHFSVLRGITPVARGQIGGLVEAACA
jgi:3-hydroxyacyl-[acyl-carrier-protein] dehydratase